MDEIGAGSEQSSIHLPAVLAGEFGIARSEARRAIAQGHVKVNGQVVTDLDLDLSSLPGDGPVAFEIDRAYPRDAIVGLLERSGYCP